MKIKGKTYKEKKNAVQEMAITYQQKASQKSTSWEEINRIDEHFRKIAKQYGLIQEFKENGII